MKTKPIAAASLAAAALLAVASASASAPRSGLRSLSSGGREEAVSARHEASRVGAASSAQQPASGADEGGDGGVCAFCPEGTSDSILPPGQDGGTCEAAKSRADALNFQDDACAEVQVWQELCCQSRTTNQIVPIEVLEEYFAEFKHGTNKGMDIARSCSSMVSTTASSLLIWMVAASKDRLTTTYHRLLLGLSVSDILFSLGNVFFNSLSPTDMSYSTWNVHGNEASCTTSGFLDRTGMVSGLLYMCSVNLYYLAKVRYGRTDEHIKRRIEPFLHVVPIFVSLVISVTSLINENYNMDGVGGCVSRRYEPPHCIGYEDGEVREGFTIPCGRGHSIAFVGLALMVVFFATPLIIGISLFLIYKAVKKQERAISAYGAGALNADSQRGSGRKSLRDTVSAFVSTRRSRLSRFSIRSSRSSVSGASVSASASVSAQRDSMSRAVMYRALSYSAAYLLAWVWPLMVLIMGAAGLERLPLAFGYVWIIMTPLQGLFTFLVYMQPRVMRSRKMGPGGTNVAWPRAFAIAFWSGLAGRKIEVVAGNMNRNVAAGQGGRPKADTISTRSSVQTVASVSGPGNKMAGGLAPGNANATIRSSRGDQRVAFVIDLEEEEDEEKSDGMSGTCPPRDASDTGEPMQEEEEGDGPKDDDDHSCHNASKPVQGEEENDNEPMQ